MGGGLDGHLPDVLGEALGRGGLAPGGGDLRAALTPAPRREHAVLSGGGAAELPPGLTEQAGQLGIRDAERVLGAPQDHPGLLGLALLQEAAAEQLHRRHEGGVAVEQAGHVAHAGAVAAPRQEHPAQEQPPLDVIGVHVEGPAQDVEGRLGLIEGVEIQRRQLQEVAVARIGLQLDRQLGRAGGEPLVYSGPFAVGVALVHPPQVELWGRVMWARRP